ncbi:MAG TPA: hypothetical protein VFD93_09250, partial [Candidatus Acidoferrales bacterium]|nr:hypothetical protein [Candidatus Acidoferrales bacterium]
MPKNSIPWLRASPRRRLLQVLGGAGLAGLFGNFNSSLSYAETLASFYAGSSLPAFEEIPRFKSGILWTHTGGLSPQMYEPETLG